MLLNFDGVMIPNFFIKHCKDAILSLNSITTQRLDSNKDCLLFLSKEVSKKIQEKQESIMI
ncbi:hypothetical protein [Helicobacter apodemus]|uniref:Uncharacterized protein n=1 Tax=Helicobacter apodemus TaxID=135569 RepID=A0A2U8FEL6_9HELI|nr:hypothetical protein [Helicobacter apodemus]AWI34574.1 hypothetical protein CDV25_07200 [Helicobacter apodemus]